MSNYRSIKEVFDEKINQQEILDYVIRKSRRSRRKIFIEKYILVPSTLIMTMFFSYFFLKGYETVILKPNDFSHDKIMIHILEEGYLDNGKYDIGGMLFEISEETEKKLLEEYPFLDSLEEMKDIKSIKKMGYDNCTNCFVSSPSIYVYSYYGKEDKEYQVSFSKTTENLFLSCVLDNTFDLKESIISNQPMKILKYQNHFLVYFQYKDTYFGVKTENITEEELIIFLKSIVKGN